MKEQLTTPLRTDLLAELIKQKHSVLAQLRQFSDRQAELVQKGEVAHLLSLLSAKQQLLNSLQSLDRRLDPFRSEDPASRVWRTPEHRRETRDLAEHSETLLAEIMQLEQDSEKEMLQQRDDAASTIQSANHTAQARSAYLETQPLTHRQLDLSSES